MQKLVVVLQLVEVEEDSFVVLPVKIGENFSYWMKMMMKLMVAVEIQYLKKMKKNHPHLLVFVL